MMGTDINVLLVLFIDSFIFTRGLKALSSKDIAGLDSGEDINDALLRSSDPATLEVMVNVN